ncbi:MAG TPA: acyl-CoA carboxylase subunit epsilon [Solirubrobacteraceae bacterium]|nr:acyl-CoA carboxylase subunit epsilon [Solirubrobacteraceae bacterium]
MGEDTGRVYVVLVLGTFGIACELRHNVPMSEDGPHLRLIAPSASPEEAAAIVAALERFMRATAPPPAAVEEPRDPWRRAAVLEGISRSGQEDVPDPWINT